MFFDSNLHMRARERVVTFNILQSAFFVASSNFCSLLIKWYQKLASNSVILFFE